MKRSVFVILMIILFVAIFFIVLYCCFSSEAIDKKMTEISLVIFQSMITGTITFCGLFITISSQEFDNKEKEILNLCPCLIIKKTKCLSTLRDVTSIRDNERIVKYCDDCKVRTIEITVCNCKPNYCLNLSLNGPTGFHLLGCIKDQDIDINIALKDKDDSIRFIFEDANGIKYEQLIDYKYNNNLIEFISRQPVRIKK